MHTRLLPAVASLLVLAAAALAQDDAAPDARVTVDVDPRVELMSIIFRLAGNPEYNQPNSRSPYADEVEAWFGEHRDHPVVRTAQALRRKRGVSYDAVMSMAIHLEDTETLAERIPFDQRPARLDARWQTLEAREFLLKARDFVEETEFNRFIAAHGAFYEKAAARLRLKFEERAYVDWFDGFFGERPGATFQAIPGLLNGGGNYGVGIRFPDGSEEITPVIGVWNFDGEGVPIFGAGIEGTIAHELCHSYTNPVVDRSAEALRPAGERIYPHRAAAMKQQAYGNWKTMMYESLVRACTVRYALANDGEAAARQEAEHHHVRGFTWTGELAELLGEYETARNRYPALDDFMPRVVAFFDEQADLVAAQAARAPKVVSMIPANGATDVDPGLETITVTFDRTMVDQSWSVVGGGPNFPEIAGSPSYDATGTVLTIPVRLKPDWSYQYWLNRGRFNSFRSREGVALEPVEVTFETRSP